MRTYKFKINPKRGEGCAFWATVKAETYTCAIIAATRMADNGDGYVSDLHFLE